MGRYSSRKNGTSLGTLIRNCSTEGENRPNLIVIHTCCGSIIGALASHQIKASEHFFGSRETFVFGSSEGCYGIWIEGSLLRGTSQVSKTFDNPVLTKQKDFQILAIEVWDFC